MDRLFKSGLVTTILGVVILGAVLYMWVTKNATQTEAYAMAALGLMFLRSKDSLIGIKETPNNGDEQR